MKSQADPVRDIGRILRQQRALAGFGTFAFRETSLQAVLSEAARICAESLTVPYCKICKYRPEENDLLIVAGHGWRDGIIGRVVSKADVTSPQGRAFITGEPQICGDIEEPGNYAPPSFYKEHHIVSTADVIVTAEEGVPYGVLEVDSTAELAFDDHDVDFLTGFANVLAQAVTSSTRAANLRAAVEHMKHLVEEKELLSQELHHRVRNSLHLVYGLVDAEFDAASGDSRERLKSLALKVMGLAQVYNHLLGTGMSRAINLGTYIDSLCITLPTLHDDCPGVNLSCVTERLSLDLDTVTLLGIIVAELVTNSYGHAFPTGTGEITVALQGTKTGRGMLIVSDDGVGFDGGGENKRRGLGLVRRLMQQVGGAISVRSDHGTTWTLDFPVSVTSQIRAA